jgi:hypothetical protein
LRLGKPGLTRCPDSPDKIAVHAVNFKAKLQVQDRQFGLLGQSPFLGKRSGHLPHFLVSERFSQDQQSVEVGEFLENLVPGII